MSVEWAAYVFVGGLAGAAASYARLRWLLVNTPHKTVQIDLVSLVYRCSGMVTAAFAFVLGRPFNEPLAALCAIGTYALVVKLLRETYRQPHRP